MGTGKDLEKPRHFTHYMPYYHFHINYFVIYQIFFYERELVHEKYLDTKVVHKRHKITRRVVRSQRSELKHIDSIPE